ncbi:MAG TPA: hypothetical protein VF517_09525, partial [Thermoleophilaceae bacterium]
VTLSCKQCGDPVEVSANAAPRARIYGRLCGECQAIAKAARRSKDGRRHSAVTRPLAASAQSVAESTSAGRTAAVPQATGRSETSAPRPDELKQLVCADCGGEFSVPRSHGRYPSKCPDCATGRRPGAAPPLRVLAPAGIREEWSGIEYVRVDTKLPRPPHADLVAMRQVADPVGAGERWEEAPAEDETTVAFWRRWVGPDELVAEAAA